MRELQKISSLKKDIADMDNTNHSAMNKINNILQMVENLHRDFNNIQRQTSNLEEGNAKVLQDLEQLENRYMTNVDFWRPFITWFHILNQCIYLSIKFINERRFWSCRNNYLFLFFFHLFDFLIALFFMVGPIGYLAVSWTIPDIFAFRTSFKSFFSTFSALESFNEPFNILVRV